MTLEAGFIMADSAVIGLRIGLPGSDRSIITTWEVSPTFSRTQMNLSDSIVKLANPICCTLMPTFCNWGRERGKVKGKVKKTTRLRFFKQKRATQVAIFAFYEYGGDAYLQMFLEADRQILRHD